MKKIKLLRYINRIEIYVINQWQCYLKMYSWPIVDWQPVLEANSKAIDGQAIGLLGGHAYSDNS